jgi:hypothetical protein
LNAINEFAQAPAAEFRSVQCRVSHIELRVGVALLRADGPLGEDNLRIRWSFPRGGALDDPDRQGRDLVQVVRGIEDCQDLLVCATFDPNRSLSGTRRTAVGVTTSTFFHGIAIRPDGARTSDKWHEDYPVI